MKIPLLLTLLLALVSVIAAHKIPLLRTRHPVASSTDTAHQQSKRNIKSDTLFSASSIVVPVSIGTPAQQVYVLLDTASSDLALFSSAYVSQYEGASSSASASSSSSTAAVLGEPFNSSASSSFLSLTESFENQYGSGETLSYFQAQVSKETLSLQTYTLTDQSFGLINEGNVTYGPLASGILGLAFEGASTGMKTTPAVQQLYLDKALPQPVFSFALMRPSSESEETSQESVTQPGGIFTLGELDSDQYYGDIGWSSLVTSNTDSGVPTKWLAKLDNITVNGALVTGSKGMVANFDTGSSATRASTAFLDGLFAKSTDAQKDDSGDYYVPCGDGIPPLLNMTISMGGISVDIEPLDLLYKTQSYATSSTQGSTSLCLSTLSSTVSSDYDIQIGDDILRSLFVAFQYDPPRIGLAPQSLDVHNQGAKPSYVFSGTEQLITRSLASPTNSASLTLATVENVPTTAILSQASVIEEEGATYTIQAGGSYVSDTTRTMQTVVASSTPIPIGSTISTSSIPSSTAGSSDTKSTSLSSSSSSAACSTSLSPSTPQLFGAMSFTILLLVSSAFFCLPC
ncbi:hypothetical protein CBS101457_002841 [Exobasidium rhododendri]|nr:hypothetical protein CBS101457_002841 [Exobasidium rhododendri]